MAALQTHSGGWRQLASNLDVKSERNREQEGVYGEEKTGCKPGIPWPKFKPASQREGLNRADCSCHQLKSQRAECHSGQCVSISECVGAGGQSVTSRAFKWAQMVPHTEGSDFIVLFGPPYNNLTGLTQLWCYKGCITWWISCCYKIPCYAKFTDVLRNNKIF